MKKLLYVNDLGWNIIVDGVISEYDMLTLKEKIILMSSYFQ